MPKCKNADTGTYKGTEPSPKGLGYCARGEKVGKKKKGLDGKECWDGYKLAGTKKKGGKTVDNCVKSEGYKGTADLSKADPAAKKKVEDRIAKHFGTKRVPGGKMGVKEEKDAFAYVVAKLKKQHGDGVLTKRDKIKPQSAAEKAKVRAHQAKVDKENAAERAKDPSQGRYPKG